MNTIAQANSPNSAMLTLAAQLKTACEQLIAEGTNNPEMANSIAATAAFSIKQYQKMQPVSTQYAAAQNNISTVAETVQH